MRFERKFRIEGQDFAQVRQEVRQHPLAFRTLFPDRVVNNLYLDTPFLDFLNENLDGVGVRTKFRIRWYGQDFTRVDKPVLEVKRKDGELGDKLFAHLPNFIIGDTGLATYLQENLNRQLQIKANSATPNSQDRFREFILPDVRLEPTLFNRYVRSYLISADGKFRLTLDRKMEFATPRQAVMSALRWRLDDAVVMEIKYDQGMEASWDRVGQNLPYRIGKNSKYVNGLLLTGVI